MGKCYKNIIHKLQVIVIKLEDVLDWIEYFCYGKLGRGGLKKLPYDQRITESVIIPCNTVAYAAWALVIITRHMKIIDGMTAVCIAFGYLFVVLILVGILRIGRKFHPKKLDK